MDKKEQIIEVATKLFAKKGFENTSISEVCETAGVSKGLIFHHFKSKNGLLREIFSRTTNDIKKNNLTHKAENPYQILSLLLNSFFEQLKKDSTFLQLNVSVISQPTTREIVKDLIDERAALIFESTKKIFNEIDPINSTIRSYMFIAELDGIALNYLSIFNDFPIEEIKSELIKKYIQQ
ncbi:TetR/AcrR family transcriptional regulator [Flammeovirga kamogawensis]|uniref:TetR/AcrR family transcriptional regulator n=1 Tax=Flammeovirga kamogawensis TaxID=373891 RepID=A0ABX8GZV7_9BACT|nr:TetR/AcrR family transcriptional regulator [Flammeovirga kamogawensis]MBB6459329.1 AcrR family transcriptional regulator [Flammeovirga kamogawensis]QWG08888.1 TetR/AcrR family transcriptional regulator [Flammeovirga kamogawensis]TRX67178.1 TetR/AcrR family transcriptional regulator [Flammeovirga kamogawensis]